MKQQCHCGNVSVVTDADGATVKCEECDWYYHYKAMPPRFTSYLEEIFMWMKEREQRKDE